MKRIIPLIAMSAIITACNQQLKEEQQRTGDSEIPTEKFSEDVKITVPDIFNIEDVAYSNHDLGEFPFFTLPKGLKERAKPLVHKFDVCFFPIDGIMTPFEGKLYRVDIVSEKGEEFSKHYFQKSMENYLSSIGAVQIYDGEISREEYDRYRKLGANRGGQGDIGYFNERIRFYVIRSKEKGNIYVQFSADSMSGKLNILQEEAFQQTITKVLADEIAKDLSEKGKSILYINFDTDKSNLTTEGSETVKQIAKVLENEKDLKISIEGHTDNSGNTLHNKQLSEKRANAVLKALVADNVEASRLVATGFGSDKPLVANESEENKAKNRRVELVKIN